MTCAAGGLGKRLRPAVGDVPKALAPVAGRPFLAYLLKKLQRAGLRRVVLATGYGSALIEAAFGKQYEGLGIAYSPEAVAFGTGGALWQALPRCEGERVFVVNGDTYFDLDYEAMSRAPACDILVGVRPVAERARHGSVRLEGRQITAFGEKGASGAALVNAGIYLLRRDISARLPRTAPFSLERDILERELQRLSIEAFPSDAAFIDMGTLADFARAQELLPIWAAG